MMIVGSAASTDVRGAGFDARWPMARGFPRSRVEDAKNLLGKAASPSSGPARVLAGTHERRRSGRRQTIHDEQPLAPAMARRATRHQPTEMARPANRLPAGRLADRSGSRYPNS